jgi:hypothetical protein
MKTSTSNLPSMLIDGPAAPLPIQWLGRLVDWSVVVIGAVMITLVFFNVLSHAIGKDLAATTELCELLMVWVTFLGGAAAARRGAHMSINEFLDKLGVSNRRWADTAIGLLCLAMLGSMPLCPLVRLRCWSSLRGTPTRQPLAYLVKKDTRLRSTPSLLRKRLNKCLRF